MKLLLIIIPLLAAFVYAVYYMAVYKSDAWLIGVAVVSGLLLVMTGIYWKKKDPYGVEDDR
jgi:prepilin signal peptidase PulO-like enzyme (type II secretory pathway)